MHSAHISHLQALDLQQVLLEKYSYNYNKDFKLNNNKHQLEWTVCFVTHTNELKLALNKNAEHVFVNCKIKLVKYIVVYVSEFKRNVAEWQNIRSLILRMKT
jgi:hypothetical protein